MLHPYKQNAKALIRIPKMSSLDPADPAASPSSPGQESSRLTRANTEKDLGGIPRTRSRALTEEEVSNVNKASPERMVPEWSSDERIPAAGSWFWPLQFCCAVALANAQQVRK
jgi:hypothetical protein